MRRLLPIVLLAAACGSTPPTGPIQDPDQMGRPLELEQRERGRERSEGREPDARSTSRVLAYVNGEVITYRDILLRAGPQLAVLGEEDQKDLLEKETLLSILRDRVVYHAAVDQGVEMTRDQLDTERARRVADLERNGGTLTAFLAERGMTRREFDEELKRSFVTEKFMLSAMGLAGGAPRVRPMTDVFVSPGEVRQFWERNQDLFREPERARLRFLTLRAERDVEDREAAVEAARAKVEAARQRLLAGEDWVPVYREAVGDYAQEDAYGLLEIQRGERAPWIEDFAFGNDRGAVSEVIQKGTAYFLMQAEGHSAERVAPFDEVYERIRGRIGQVRRAMAQYEVELKLLEGAAIEPPERAEELRSILRGARRRIQDEAGF